MLTCTFRGKRISISEYFLNQPKMSHMFSNALREQFFREKLSHLESHFWTIWPRKMFIHSI